MSARRRRQFERAGGFTLIELLVAIVIVAGIAGAAVISMSQSLRASASSEARESALRRAELAVSSIATDLRNLVREGDLFYARLAVADSGATTNQTDEILMFARSLRPVRRAIAQSEGGEYEVQYRVAKAATDGAVAQTVAGGVLWRRADPVPDEVADGGGVVNPVVDGITALSIELFNGESWVDGWDSDRDGYPHAVRITCEGSSDDGRVRRWSVRTVAIDRVPLPFFVDHSETEEQTGGAT